MKKTVTIVVVIAVVLIIFFVLGPFYVIEEGQQAVVTRFGKVVSTTTQAGLKFKMPLIDNVVKYSKRLLTWDGQAQRIPTQEKMFIWVDATARWRIEDPLKFYEAVTTLEGAFGRLDEVIDSSVRTVIAENLLREAVRNSNVINTIDRQDQIEQVETEEGDIEDIASFTSVQETYPAITRGRSVLSNEMFQKASAITPQYGIKLEDIIIRQIRYSDDLTQSVYDRMIKQRNQIAEAYRSYGEGMKAEWVGRMSNEKQAVLSKAYETAEEIKGRADAEATTIYAQAYEADEEFFSFWRSIESYRKTLPQFSKTLTTDLDYFKYLYSSKGN
ncbi:MAG: protease modulator HflC [Spirochaetales bacterium]|nr:protease modulator HflC [Spirochaetales bacterium]